MVEKQSPDCFIRTAFMIKIESDRPDRIIVSFPYSPQIVAKLRTIKARQWNPAGKYWSFPHSKPALHEILTALAGEEIEIGPSLHALEMIYTHVLNRPGLIVKSPLDG